VATVSLYLLKVSSDKAKADPTNANSTDPTTWSAQYQVDYSTPDCDEDRGGKAFWFEVYVEKSRRTGYQAKATMHAPERATMREALLKLAEWARMLASGIEECDLPDEGFPAEVRKRPPPPKIVLDEVEVSP
jgi:hypothetical protein